MQIPMPQTHAAPLPPAQLLAATQQIDMKGYVVFENLLPAECMDALFDAFMQVFESYIATHAANRGSNRYQTLLPFRQPFCDELLVANPLLLQLVEALLGPEFICHYLAADTPLPGSDYQPVHFDIHPLFPEHSLVLPPYSIVVNIPLIEVTADNGPLEIWPGGSHKHTFTSPDDMQDIAGAMHSERLLMKRGSVLVRDSRMWHRGTPNRSDQPRPNLALIYSRHWLRLKYPLITISRGVYDAMSERAQYLFRRENIIDDSSA